MNSTQIKVGPMDNFSYVVWDKDTLHAAVIDPAWQPEKIKDILTGEKLALQAVLLTHAHPDHLNALRAFAADGLPVFLNDGDYFMLEDRPPALKPVSDGEELQVGSMKFSVLHTPGHTPGSVCYLAGQDLYTGDTLFIGECGRVDLPGSSPEALYDSFVKLARLPDPVKVWPGHSYNGDTSTIGVQKEYNLYLQLARQGRKADFLKAVT